LTGQTPYYPQLDERDCGATCLRMVTEHYGMPLKMERLREVSGTTERGADLAGLESGAQILGFDTLAAEIPYDQLIQGDLLPIILHWDRDHFIVVTEASFHRFQSMILQLESEQCPVMISKRIDMDLVDPGQD